MKGAKKKADTMRLTVKKTAPKGKPAKDPNKPKRPASAFFVFMEGFRKQFKEENPTITSVVAVGKAGGAKWKSMSESEKAPFVAEAEQRKTAGISSMQSVISNNELLTEILLKLPVLSLVLFKSVSKSWLSLIKDANVTFRHKLDWPSGLILERDRYSFKNCSISYNYKFVPLDIRIPLLATNFTFNPDVHDDFRILDSCNGLLVGHTHKKLYVYNPSITSMFKVLPFPSGRVLRFTNPKMAFDPTKSPHYKVIYGEIDTDVKCVRIHTYSSETGNWSLCGYQFPEDCYDLDKGFYWNDAIYWLHGEDEFFKLDIMNEHPVLTALQTPLTLDRKVHYQCRLFESRGCLLLLGRDDAHSRHVTIYEKGNVYSEWSVKYIVNLDDIIKPFPERWSIRLIIKCIVLGEREEDSFLVMKLDNKVVQYKIVPKTLTTISDSGPDEDLVDEVLVRCFQFIPSFANV